MPYSDYDASFDRYRTLISIINQRAPRFTVHLGDIKDGYNPCSDVALSAQLDLLNAIDGPVLYTPGDNEWTDCYREKAGAYSPLERLAFIRKTFFVQGARTLGRRRIAVERQADVMSDYRKYVENVRFAIGGVRVISAHVVGSNNNFEVRDRAAANEFFDRDQANIAWLGNSIDLAIAADASAIVLLIHADMFDLGFLPRREVFLRHSGYLNFGEALIDKARAFARPILLVFGDGHKFGISRPFRRRAPNILAVEVHGARNMHAVEVLVDPTDPAVFSVRQVINPASPH